MKSLVIYDNGWRQMSLEYEGGWLFTRYTDKVRGETYPSSPLCPLTGRVLDRLVNWLFEIETEELEGRWKELAKREGNRLCLEKLLTNG